MPPSLYRTQKKICDPMKPVDASTWTRNGEGDVPGAHEHAPVRGLAARHPTPPATPSSTW
jgi:hypothetical protein